MKKQIICALSSVIILSCGGSKKDDFEDIKSPSNAFEALSNLSKAGKEMKNNLSKAEEKIKERKERGDTLAMHYEKLMEFLPEEIDGYKRKEPNGSSVNMAGMSYSSVDARYEKEDGEYIKITIVDYNQAYGIYQSATAMWAMGMSIDTPTEKANGVKLNDEIAGWETFKKKSKEATLTLGVGYRFWLNIEANKQENTDFLKNVAKRIDLDKLTAI